MVKAPTAEQKAKATKELRKNLSKRPPRSYIDPNPGKKKTPTRDVTKDTDVLGLGYLLLGVAGSTGRKK